MNGQLYAGGRTTGALGSALTGTTDGFIARLDSGTGAIDNVSQFGQKALQTEPVRISAASGGKTVLSALGLHRGSLNPPVSGLLTTETSLRAGDEFSVQVNGKDAQKFTILANDTMDTLMQRIKSYAGVNATVSTVTISGKTSLRIEAKDGSPVELIAGADGKDALAKLGISPERLTVPHIATSDEPKVSPGGTYGLALSSALDISTTAGAGVALNQLASAISTSQSGYRSLYWDDTKVMMVDGTTQPSTDPVIAGQLANYQAALDRLTSSSSSSLTTSTMLGF
jgi:hypothetical protein